MGQGEEAARASPRAQGRVAAGAPGEGASNVRAVAEGARGSGRAGSSRVQKAVT